MLRTAAVGRPTVHLDVRVAGTEERVYIDYMPFEDSTRDVYDKVFAARGTYQPLRLIVEGRVVQPDATPFLHHDPLDGAVTVMIERAGGYVPAWYSMRRASR